MSIFRKFIAPVALVLSLGQAQAQAQLHEGDVEMSVVSSQIVLNGHDVIQFGTGFKIFEGDFGDFAKGPWETDDPGYDSAPGTFLPRTVITYNTVGSLWHWNGGNWGLAGAERVSLEGNLGEQSFFSGTGTSGDLTGLVGEASLSGVVHEHLDMVVSRVGVGTPAIGSYMFQLYLTGTNLIASDTFLMVLNHRLSDDDFQMSVQALAVPEPTTWLLWMGGLALIGAAARRRH